MPEINGQQFEALSSQKTRQIAQKGFRDLELSKTHLGG
jgi:hypothetical protein